MEAMKSYYCDSVLQSKNMEKQFKNKLFPNSTGIDEHRLLGNN